MNALKWEGQLPGKDGALERFRIMNGVIFEVSSISLPNNASRSVGGKR